MDPTALRDVRRVSPSSTPEKKASLEDRLRETRARTAALAEGLAPEDQVVQSMEDVSPTKWHLAHTTWFFETFVLVPHLRGYRLCDERYPYLFNSYYVQAGARHCRDRRGHLSRPTVDQVLEYRRHVDSALEALLAAGPGDLAVRELLELGVNHEQQHQELILTDLKHVFSVNPLRPEYPAPGWGVPDHAQAGAAPTWEQADGRASDLVRSKPSEEAPATAWIDVPEGVHEIGWSGEDFAYDNEGPRHRSFLESARLASRPVTNGEFLEFMEDGGYRTPELWMSEGWTAVQALGWNAPFYWEEVEGEWWSYTLGGMRRIDPREPVCHVNWYEADAFARWAGARLPREEEWEVVARSLPIQGNLVESGRFHPAPLGSADGGGGEAARFFGDVWEWTASPYSPYPGFRPAPGAVGEYNGKFMVNQFVLRGGSCATARSHIRPTYRNFFHPDKSWQFTGIRLAKDASAD